MARSLSEEGKNFAQGKTLGVLDVDIAVSADNCEFLSLISEGTTKATGWRQSLTIAAVLVDLPIKRFRWETQPCDGTSGDMSFD